MQGAQDKMRASVAVGHHACCFAFIAIRGMTDTAPRRVCKMEATW